MEIFAYFSCISAKNIVSLQRNKASRKHGFYSKKTMALSGRKSMIFMS